LAPGRNLHWNTRTKDENGQDIFISLRDAAEYINEEFLTALEVYCVTENLGCLPFAGGWAEQPEWIVRAVTALKTEIRKADEDEREIKQQEEEAHKKYGK